MFLISTLSQEPNFLLWKHSVIITVRFPETCLLQVLTLIFQNTPPPSAFSDTVFIFSSSGFLKRIIYYINELVICNHAPHPPPSPGEQWGLTFLLAIPCYNPHTAGQQAGKTMAVLPHSLSCFTVHCHVCLGISNP